MRSVRQTIQRHVAFIGALMVVCIWGETFVSSKMLLQGGMMPADIFFCRFLLAYLCMWALCHKTLFVANWRHEVLLAAMGVLGGSMYFLTENMALVYSTASNVAILVGTTPLVTSLIYPLFYRKERLCRRQLLGSLIAFVGMVMVVLNGQLVLHLNPLGDMLAFSASLTWAFYTVVMRKVTPHYPSLLINRKVFGYGLLSIVPYFLFVQPLQCDVAVYAQPSVWGNLLYLGLVASMGCYLVWTWSIKRLGAIRASNILYCQCLVTMGFSAMILSERITLMAVAGALILIAGMAFADRK